MSSASELVVWSWVQPYFRPALILVCGMLMFNLPVLLYKITLVFNTVRYLLFCNDKKWKKPMDPGSVFSPHMQAQKPVDRKTIYFIRHGESTWNDTFNKGQHRSALVFVLGFVPGLIKAVAYEVYLLLSGKLDSWFYDSPLSFLGLDQVEQLALFLEKGAATKAERNLVKILRADPGAPSSRILCSNLRRAISTIAGGLRDRFDRRPNDKIVVLHSLQEISRNPDALSITPGQTPIQASWIEKTSKVCDFQEIFATQVDTNWNMGNKSLNSTGFSRMNEFCQYVFQKSVREQHIIVGGHSLWFKSFFQNFLPFNVSHPAKKKKIINGGVVAFELLRAQTQYGEKYMVDPKSIRVVYGGF